MAEYRGTAQVDNFTGTDDDDGFERLGQGADTINGGARFDFVSYRNDGGNNGIVAVFGADGNGTIVDTFGSTDTITSVQGYEGTDLADQFTFQNGADFNVQPGRGADRIVLNDIRFGTLDYAFYFNDEVEDFVRELDIEVTGITLDFAAGTITEYNGTVDTFNPVEDLQIRGTGINDILRAGNDGFQTVLDGRGGSDLLIAGDEFDRASFRREGADIGTGFNINLATGMASNTANSDVDTLQNFRFVEGSDFADTFTGSSASEEFVSGAGNDTIDAGNGIDTAIYWDNERSEFSLTGIGTSTITITHLNGGEAGVDVLSDVEQIEFDNGLLRVDINGNAGQAYRLYQAAFDRTPDQDGLSFWIEEIDGGMSLQAAANQFIGSDEFQALYGSPETVSNADFVTLVYQNVLDRGPDQGGYTYWVDQLESGYGRDRLLASFSESNENVANVAAQIAGGIFFEYD